MSDRYTSSINVYLTNLLKGNLIWPKIQLQQYNLYLISYWFYKDKFFPSDPLNCAVMWMDRGVNGIEQQSATFYTVLYKYDYFWVSVKIAEPIYMYMIMM